VKRLARDPRKVVAQHRGGPVAQPAIAIVALAVTVAVTVVVTSAAGCVSSRPAPPDAGSDGGRDVKAPMCLLNTICADDANAVQRCNQDRTVGVIIEDCGDTQACSLGRCTTPACADAEHRPTTAGCLFYGADVANVESDHAQPTVLVAANAGPGPATVTVELREAGQLWTTVQSISIEAGGAGTFTLPNRQFTDAGKGAARAYRLVSDTPVQVIAVQSDDADQTSSSSGGTQLLPAHALGLSYMATAYPQVDTPKLDATPGSRGGAGAITIVATQDGTTVTYVASRAATAVDLGGGVTGHAGDSYTVSLDDGDVFQLFTADETADLTGSQIMADRPVALFSGNVSTTYGRVADGLNTPDLTVEQILPTSVWSTTYVAAQLAPQATVCDSVLGGLGTSLWRVVAARNDTHVTFDAPQPLDGLPPDGLVLAQGEARDLIVAGPGDFTIRSDQPIAVMQGMDCEPTMSSAVATDSLMDDLLFALPANFDHQLAIVRPTGMTVRLDGVAIDDPQFAAAGRGFEVAHVPVPPCNGSPGSCVHRLQGRFGLTWRGMDIVCAYALTAMTWKPCFDTGCMNAL